MASYLISPVHTVKDRNGKPISGAKVYIYLAGTTTLASLFTDSALSASRANPIICDANGVWLSPYMADGDYKVTYTDASDVALSYPGIDDLPTFITSSNGAVSVANGGTGATTAEQARSNLGAASAADVSSLSSEVTDVANNLAGIPGGVLGDVAALDSVSVTDLSSGFDAVCIQEEYTSSSSVSTITTAVPVGTTPTTSNGTQLFSIAFTPSRADSTLEFEADIVLKANNNLQAVIYLCRSDQTNAVQVKGADVTSTREDGITLKHRLATGATDSITFSIRAGVSSGDSLTFNSASWGGIASSSFRIREIVNTPVS